MFALDLIIPPIVAGLVILSIHAYLGLHVIARGVIFVDLAFAQIAALARRWHPAGDRPWTGGSPLRARIHAAGRPDLHVHPHG